MICIYCSVCFAVCARVPVCARAPWRHQIIVQSLRTVTAISQSFVGVISLSLTSLLFSRHQNGQKGQTVCRERGESRSSSPSRSLLCPSLDFLIFLLYFFLSVLQVCEIKNCNKCIFFEAKKKKDLYMWWVTAEARVPPSASAHVQSHITEFRD